MTLIQLPTQSDLSTEMPVSQTCGEYQTPPFYAAVAHRYLLRAAADNQTDTSLYDTHDWWDPFAGTGRLLVPFPARMAGRLYSSTLAAADVDTLRLQQPFRQSCVFRYDFLNQPDEALPHELRARLRPASRWVFILNPPFVGHRTRRGERGQAVVDTAMRAAMLPRRLGRASQNLTTQGLYRLLELVREHDLDATVGVFSQASVWTGGGYSHFGRWWRAEFGFADGFLFPAREFEGVTGEWPAAFTVWRRGRVRRPLVLDVMERGEPAGIKELRQPDQPLGTWIARPRNSEMPVPQVTSALTLATGKRTRREKLAKDALGYITWLGNDVRNSKGTCLLSAPSGQAGWSITPSNFEQSLSAAAARMLPKPNWLNDADQFSAPDTNHPLYEQFLADALAWLVGSTGNHTASLGELAHQGQPFDLPNHFFWMSPDEMLRIKDLPEVVCASCESSETRFVADWLLGRTFSPDADWVRAELTRIVAVTASARPLAPPEFQLLRWDAGWYQIRKGLCWPSPTYTPPPTTIRRYRAWKRRHKRLGERLAAQLYDLGFLPRPMIPYEDSSPLLNPSTRGI